MRTARTATLRDNDPIGGCITRRFERLPSKGYAPADENRVETGCRLSDLNGGQPDCCRGVESETREYRRSLAGVETYMFEQFSRFS